MHQYLLKKKPPLLGIFVGVLGVHVTKEHVRSWEWVDVGLHFGRVVGPCMWGACTKWNLVLLSKIEIA